MNEFNKRVVHRPNAARADSGFRLKLKLFDLINLGRANRTFVENFYVNFNRNSRIIDLEYSPDSDRLLNQGLNQHNSSPSNCTINDLIDRFYFNARKESECKQFFLKLALFLLILLSERNF